MKILARILALMVMVFFIGCATQGGGAGGAGGASGAASAPAKSSNGGDKLSKEDFKKMGIEETYENR